MSRGGEASGWKGLKSAMLVAGGRRRMEVGDNPGKNYFILPHVLGIVDHVLPVIIFSINLY